MLIRVYNANLLLLIRAVVLDSVFSHSMDFVSASIGVSQENCV